MNIDRTAILAIVAEQSQNHGKAAEQWKGTADKVAYHTGAVHVCLEIQDRIERMANPLVCPDCSGRGWWAKYPNNGDPPEQAQCEKCWGTGSLDPRAGGENIPKPDPKCFRCGGTGEYRSDLELGAVRCGCVPA